MNPHRLLVPLRNLKLRHRCFALAASCTLPPLLAAGRLAGDVSRLFHFSQEVAALKRVAGPGLGEVTVDRAGRYVLFFETRRPFSGTQWGKRSRVPGLSVTIVEKNTGKPIPMSAHWANLNYTVPETCGLSVGAIDLPNPGVYRIDTRMEGASEKYGLALAGDDFLDGIGMGFGVLKLLFLWFVYLPAGVGLLIVGLCVRASGRVADRTASSLPPVSLARTR